MSKNNATLQKKRVVLNYVYAVLVGMLVLACAITIAVVSSSSSGTANIGGEEVIPTASTTYVLPMNDATIAKDYSSKELQYNDTLKQWEIHRAIDLVSDDATVMAIADGTVSNVYTNYLEGTVIEITHSDGLISIYKSLSSDVTVSIGDSVSAGQVIGYASTSMAEELNTGAHLHLQLTLNGILVDPNDYISLGVK